MKKIILSVAFILGALTFQNASAKTALHNNSIVVVQDNYVEVAADALPAAVKSTIEKSFPKSTLEKAYVNDQKEYKLELASGDKKFTIYTNEAGEIIKK